MVARLVSGGQTGVDRAALEIGRQVGLPVGGWCPAGGRAEDLPVPAEDLPVPPGLLVLFPELSETPSADVEQRTEWNVRDSDATLVLVRRSIESPGTALTVAAAERLGRPYLVADVEDVAGVRSWLGERPATTVLNVAGPRESEAPGIQAQARELLTQAADLLSR